MPQEQIIFGDKQLIKAFEELKGTMQKKVMRKATRAVAKEDILPRAKALVPVQFGELQDSLVVKAAKVARRSGNVGTGVTTRENLFRGETFYGGFIEYGWRHWKDGSWVEGQPFLRPALYENKMQKMQILKRVSSKEIPIVVRQAAQKAKTIKR